MPRGRRSWTTSPARTSARILARLNGGNAGGVADVSLDVPVRAKTVADAGVSGDLAAFRKPALILWGPKDPVFLDRFLADLLERLPQADLHRFEAAGHLLAEDVDIAGPILHWAQRVLDPGAAPAAAEQDRDYRPLWSFLDDWREEPATALVDMAGSSRPPVSWGRLAGVVDAMAVGLVRLGVKPGDRISMMVTPGIDLTAALYASLRIGAVVVVADAGLGTISGVRLSLARAGLLRSQLRAIARASGYGPVRVLVPMVSGAEEMHAVAAALEAAISELRAEGHAVADRIPLGAMIEVPSAALALPSFIRGCDFLSIGTNDLVQYLLAADRTNEALGALYTPLHPAVVRLLRDIARTAARAGTPLSVCGEIAGDPLFVPMLLALGIEELSLHPATLLEVRRAIRAVDLSVLRAAAPALLRAADRAGIERWLARHGAA